MTATHTQVSTTDYYGNKIYREGNIAMVLTPEGYLAKQNGSWQYNYYLRDHLGNIRVVQDANGNILESTDYYPFGMPFAELKENSVQPYKFGGKELESMHGLNVQDFGLRLKEVSLLIFTTPDPLQEKYYSMSPYLYVGNNPMNAFDLNGDSIWFTIDNNVVTMHVTGKVLNKSKDNINVGRAAKDIASGISKAFEGTFEMDGQTYTMQTDIQLTAAQSMNEVADADHLFVLADADGKLARGATNQQGGKVMHIDAGDFANDNWFSNTFFSSNTLTAVHEFGHALGLLHNEDKGNLMYGKGVQKAKVTSTQRRDIYKNRYGMNKGQNYERLGNNKIPNPYIQERQWKRTIFHHINKVGLYYNR
ncbi:MAG: matrixin family metalloprotease [Candidatus Azobacteroides sp.]|nr:matrixin family metalloprotease [Candidatus Azobacteroides sp.]